MHFLIFLLILKFSPSRRLATRARSALQASFCDLSCSEPGSEQVSTTDASRILSWPRLSILVNRRMLNGISRSPKQDEFHHAIIMMHPLTIDLIQATCADVRWRMSNILLITSTYFVRIFFFLFSFFGGERRGHKQSQRKHKETFQTTYSEKFSPTRGDFEKLLY